MSILGAPFDLSVNSQVDHCPEPRHDAVRTRHSYTQRSSLVRACWCAHEVIALLWISDKLIGIIVGLALLLPIAIWALSIPALISSRMAPPSA